MNKGKSLRIVLSKNAAFSGSGGDEKKHVSREETQVTYLEHLTLSNLPVGKSIGPVPPATQVKNIGSIVHRKPGSKIHFCILCDHPIAIYGRLIPCTHAFCRDCAKSHSKCTICEESITKIQSINMGSGIYVCGMVTCLKSFLEHTELNNHIKECHGVAGSTSAKEDSGELQ